MRQVLKLHPDSQCAAVSGIEVEVERPSQGWLRLRYVLTGVTSDLALPPPDGMKRADGLWRHTCFEAFTKTGPTEAYHEFNFAPSLGWAVYRFDRYREGMKAVGLFGPPEIESIQARSDADRFELTADVYGAPDTAFSLGLATVIEETGGGLTYWALAHAPGKPDFHHPDCFVLEVPPLNRP